MIVGAAADGAGVDISASAHLTAADLLRRQVVERADDLTLDGHLVGDADVPPGTDEHASERCRVDQPR
jgi:hypothetical protein